MHIFESWGANTIYGAPSGILFSFMDALGETREHNVKFLQVKHEEVDAMTSVMQYKFGGSLGVCVGSGGPGSTHLINGLYDAFMDNTPVVAILESRPVRELNMDAFQELK